MPPQYPQTASPQYVSSSPRPSRAPMVTGIVFGIIVVIAAGFAVYHFYGKPASSDLPAGAVSFNAGPTTEWFSFEGNGFASTTAPADFDPSMQSLVTRADGASAYGTPLPPSEPKAGDPLPVIIPGAAPAPTVWALTLVPAPHAAGVALGVGRPLGFIADGSLLALTPEGVVAVSVPGGARRLVVSLSATSTGAALSPDGSSLAVYNPGSKSIDVYTVNQARPTASTYLGSVRGSGSPVALSYDAAKLFVLNWGDSVDVFEFKAGTATPANQLTYGGDTAATTTPSQ